MPFSLPLNPVLSYLYYSSQTTLSFTSRRSFTRYNGLDHATH